MNLLLIIKNQNIRNQQNIEIGFYDNFKKYHKYLIIKNINMKQKLIKKLIRMFKKTVKMKNNNKTSNNPHI